MTVLNSYDTMMNTARRQPEGSLIYILDKADLYLRVRDGLRQVLLGEYNPFFRDLENEVAEVHPPPVVVYPQSPVHNPLQHRDPNQDLNQDQSQSNGAGHYSESVIRPLEPPVYKPNDREPVYPPHYDPRFPDSRLPAGGQTDASQSSQRPENHQPYPALTTQRRPNHHHNPDRNPHHNPHHNPQPNPHIDTGATGLHLIALNSPQPGNMRGIRGADFQCFQQARAVGLKGTFRAFLSSKLQDLYTIVRKSDRDGYRILNLKGQVLFENWEKIFGDNAEKLRESVPIYSFDGRDILRDSAWPEKMLWHGSSAQGQRQTDNYCETWRAGDRAVSGLASSLSTGLLLHQTSGSCNAQYIVLCIENAFTAHAKK